MNQRYHQHEASLNASRDLWAKVATAMFAMIGVSLALAGAMTVSGVIDWLGVTFSAIAAVAAIFLNVLPYGAREKEHVDLFRRWTDLREDIDRLEFELGDGSPTPPLAEQLQTLESKLHRICGAEALANQRLWRQCQRAEQSSRNIPVLPDDPEPVALSWRDFVPAVITRRIA